MEDRRTAIAIILSIMVVLVYTQTVVAPKQAREREAAEMAAAKKLKVDGAENLDENLPKDSVNSLGELPTKNESPAEDPTLKTTEAQQGTATATKSLPTLEQIKSSPKVTVKTKLFTAEFSELGARLSEFRLNKHKAVLAGDHQLDMVSYADGTPLPLGLYIGKENDANVKYELVEPAVRLGSKSFDLTNPAIKNSDTGEFELKFQGKLEDGSLVTKTYYFNNSNYLIRIDVKAERADQAAGSVWLEWAEFDNQTGETARLNPKHTTLLGVDNKIVHHQTKDIIAAGRLDPTSNAWAAYNDKYFMAALIPPTKNQNTQILAKDHLIRTIVRGTEQGGEFYLYLGPKQYTDLKKLPHSLERSIDLGVFTFLAYPLLAAIRWFYSILGNYGLAIILLTLCIKTLFLPLTSASLKSMRAMQDLQPEIKALRERVKDPAQLNQEMMALYKKRGVNPLGGCLPMLIQIPVFFGLYNALLNAIELRHAHFALWITDLSSPERLDIFGIGVPVMILIMGATMYIQQKTQPSAMDEMQRKMMTMMPIIFTVMFIIFPFPSGLVLYWLVNNLISIVQQVYLRNEKKATPFQATVLASVLIFSLGYILTLI